MPRIDNSKFYTASIIKHGYSARGMGWLSKERQQTRFEVLYSLLDSDLHDASLVDAGCGMADFYDFLQRKNNLPKKYIGIDMHLPLLEEAEKNKSIATYQRDIITDTLIDADYYLCSGAMNILTKDETYAFIHNVMIHTKKAFVFNILLGSDDSLIYNHFLESELIDIAQALDVRFKSQKSYLKDDISMIFYKDQ